MFPRGTGTWSSVSFTRFSLFLLTSAEGLAEDVNPRVPKMPSESASEGPAPKVPRTLNVFHVSGAPNPPRGSFFTRWVRFEVAADHVSTFRVMLFY